MRSRADVHIDDWDYDHHHTHQTNWKGVCRDGKRQSPINIDTRKTVKKNWTEPFVLAGYDQKISVLVRNNRHTIVVTPTQKLHKKIFVRGGGLGTSRFQFAQAHFHWGSTNDQGSEHTIDEKSAPMEMHLVHWNLDVDPILSKAVKTGANNSLEVLGVHFKIGKKNQKFEDIFQSIKHVKKENKTTTIENGIKLKDLLPDNKLQYYRYYGSLTTPSCNEIVVWTIFKQKIEISQGQLDEIRKVYYHRTGETEVRDISNNYREPQPLHERHVEEINTQIKFESHPNSTQVPHGNTGISPRNHLKLNYRILFVLLIMILNKSFYL